MSNTTVLNVKIDKELKRQAQETAKAMGLPVSTLVTTSLKEIIRAQSITIRTEPRLKPEIEKELLEMSRAYKEGKREQFSPAFDIAEDAITWLKDEVKK